MEARRTEGEVQLMCTLPGIAVGSSIYSGSARQSLRNGEHEVGAMSL